VIPRASSIGQPDAAKLRATQRRFEVPLRATKPPLRATFSVETGSGPGGSFAGTCTINHLPLSNRTSRLSPSRKTRFRPKLLTAVVIPGVAYLSGVYEYTP
jgi:hypothetical protein